MDGLIGKLSVYDNWARLIAGGLVIIGAYYSGIINEMWISSSQGVSIVVLVFCSYGVGLIFEEISYILESKLKLRKKIEQKVCKKDKYIKYDLEKCKNALIKNEKEEIANEPLGHIVLAVSLKIAYTCILVLKVCNIICKCDKNIQNSIIIIVVLTLIIVVLHLREKHYCCRRIERIFEYCIAKEYPEILRIKK